MCIDIHAHYVPTEVLTALEKSPDTYGVHVKTAVQGGQYLHFGYGPILRPFLPKLLELDQRSEWMQEHGIDKQLLSVWPDIFGYGLPTEAGCSWHRLLNESLCEAARKQPKRFGALASVPLQHPYRAAEELAYAVEECGAVGGIIGANIDGRNLDDQPMDPFWAAAEDLNVPLFLHPVQPSPTSRTGQYYINAIVRYIYDTTVAIACLVFSGVLDRFPKLKIILAHGGGFFPYQVGRFDQAYNHVADSRAVAAQPPSAYLKRFSYDSIVNHPASIRFLADLVGVDNIVLGTDYPFPVGDIDPLQSLGETGLTDDEATKISEGNAKLLFNL